MAPLNHVIHTLALVHGKHAAARDISLLIQTQTIKRIEQQYMCGAGIHISKSTVNAGTGFYITESLDQTGALVFQPDLLSSAGSTTVSAWTDCLCSSTSVVGCPTLLPDSRLAGVSGVVVGLCLSPVTSGSGLSPLTSCSLVGGSMVEPPASPFGSLESTEAFPSRII